MRLTYQELTAVVTLLEQEEEKLRKDKEEAHNDFKVARDAFTAWANEKASTPEEAENIYAKKVAPLEEEYERKLDRHHSVKSALGKFTSTSYEL